tara:strand:- start:332 stop:1969 length:1638 start_codon:yes stop_codon:yes gene_type:complete
MANTGYQISPTINQYYTTGPNSGSIVTSSFNTDLTISPFSASLNNEEYFYRSFNPIDCIPGINTCISPILTNVNTGSQRGRFAINYLTESGSNPPIDITASISNDLQFGTSEVFSASIDSIIPVTTSFVSGTVYFKSFISCSGPTPSPNSNPLSFTYDLLPPLTELGDVNIVFKNNLSSPMEVQIRSLRGNLNYNIESRESVTYDYKTSTNKSEDLSVTIKGGTKSSYGNSVQRTTTGILKETYTTGGGYNNPSQITDNSLTLTPDKGLSFNIRQLSLPKNGNTTTTTFTLLNNTPKENILLQFGSVPYSTQNDACAVTGVNYREKTYFRRNGYLYNSRADALDDVKSNFPYLNSYILTSITDYLIVNQKGYIQNTLSCVLPTITIDTSQTTSPDQESACKRNKTNGTIFSYKDNRLVGNNISGRYPLYEDNGGRGGRNVLLSNGTIIGYETCGTELSTVYYGDKGWDVISFPLNTPENVNPKDLNTICNSSLTNYLLGPSGIVYYDVSSNPYIPLGTGVSWYKTSENTFVNFDNGQIIDTTSPC